MQEIDPDSRKPSENGTVGILTFSRKDQVDEGLLYATHVNYHITVDEEGVVALERHVTQTEHGPHKVRESIAKSARGPEQLPRELQALRASVDTSRALEEETGVMYVFKQEAHEIIDFLTKQNTQ